VLTLYDQNHESCKFYNDLIDKITERSSTTYKDEGWKLGMPWLTYTQSATSLLKTSLKTQDFELTVGFYDD